MQLVRHILPSLISPWQLLAMVIAALLLLPMVAILASIFAADSGVVDHLFTHVMGRYLGNSALLLLGVSVCTFILGTTAAWLVTMYQFPLRRFFQLMLLLPLAMPAYVLAMVYGYLLEPAGPLQSWYRTLSGASYGDYVAPDIRSMVGAILVLSFALYPYVYMLARASFARHSRQVLDSARLLGVGGWRLFFAVALPIARPAIVVGVALVGMETLADFGVVSLFGIDSFTTAIYRAWYGMGDQIAAAKLSAMLLVLAAGVLWIERKSRGAARYDNRTALYHPLPETKLTGLKALIAVGLCCIPPMVGAFIPMAALIDWSLLRGQGGWADALTWNAFAHSFMLGISVSLLALVIAIYFSIRIRANKASSITRNIMRASALGYAIPGSVIAVGILIPMLWFDKWLADTMLTWFDWDIGLLITGSMAGIVFACVVRFMAIALGSVESAFEAVSHTMDDAAEMLGMGVLKRSVNVHFPIIKKGVGLAAIVLFVDTVKELPATLMLRPFNFDTLSIRTYELAMDEQLIAAATPALMMVMMALIPVLLLARYGDDLREG